MIPSLDNKIKSLTRAEKSFQNTVIETAKEFKAEILDLNTEEQLFQKGEDGQGRPITPAYTRFTVQYKRAVGQPTDRVTLKDTGDFHDSFKIRFNKKDFAIFATDQKTQKLERKYGKDITGLNNKSMRELAEMMRDDFTNELRKQIV